MTFSISTFFGTPCSNGDQFCLMPKVLANLPGSKAFLHQSCASFSRTPASSLPGRMLLDVFFCYSLLLIFIFLSEVQSEGQGANVETLRKNTIRDGGSTAL